VARRLAVAIDDGRLEATEPHVQAAYAQLIKLPEHTYGSNDGKVSGLPWDNHYMDQHINDSNFRVTNSGWADQRAYIDRAIEALGALPLRKEIEGALAASSPAPVNMSGLNAWKLGVGGAPEGTLGCMGGELEIGFDATGAISSLMAGTRQWADANHTLGRFRYRTHSESEFDAYGDRYMLPGCRANETNGALCGFGKQGLTTVAGASNADWAPKLTAAWKDTAACKAVMQYTFDATAQSKYGAPSVADTTVSLAPRATGQAMGPRLLIDVQYHKRQTRMAESLWLSFAPIVKSPRGWRFDKLGRSIDPFDVVRGLARIFYVLALQHQH
jgi:hypothetical protein